MPNSLGWCRTRSADAEHSADADADADAEPDADPDAAPNADADAELDAHHPYNFQLQLTMPNSQLPMQVLRLIR